VVSTGRAPRVPSRLPEGAILRTNPDYELVSLDRLAVNERLLVVPEGDDSDLYGVLRPRSGSRLPIRAVTQETALLLFSLQEPGPPPHYVIGSYGGAAGDMLAALILDGLLQLETDSGFACGPEAHAYLHLGSRDNAQGLLARLSVEALQYAQVVDAEDVLALAARLYCFNRVPVSPRWCRAIPTPDAAASFLGLSAKKGIGGILAHHWQRVGEAPVADEWFLWRSAQANALPSGQSPRYKLYFSPSPEATSAALTPFVETMTELRAPCFKVGRGVGGLLRPDKVVAYFATHEHLAKAAARLRSEMTSGWPVQGVPFTSGIGADGLISWGLDPPHARIGLAWERLESWRAWVTRRLAHLLLQGRDAPAPRIEPWQFALDRLRFDGVDTATWTPSGDIW
jgi:hypothetical protein